jgi:hypothetical protein
LVAKASNNWGDLVRKDFGRVVDEGKYSRVIISVRFDNAGSIFKGEIDVDSATRTVHLADAETHLRVVDFGFEEVKH